jgi:hypothetical protein
MSNNRRNAMARRGMRGMGAAVAPGVVGNSPFDYTWTSPTNKKIVVQTIQFPDGVRQIVGCYVSSPVTGLHSWDNGGFKAIAASITHDNDGSSDSGQQADFGDSAAKLDNVIQSSIIFFCNGTATGVTWPVQSAPGSTYTTMQRLTLGPGWYSQGIVDFDAASNADQAYVASFQWGLAKLAAMSSTVSQVATAPGSPTLGSGTTPQVVAAPASSNMDLYLGLGAAALGAWYFLR